jgi:hypothetical protein
MNMKIIKEEKNWKNKHEFKEIMEITTSRMLKDGNLVMMCKGGSKTPMQIWKSQEVAMDNDK